VAKTTWHPGWRAWVDGREGSTLRLAPAYVGVAVDAGRHAVELRYVPSPWRAVARWLGGLTVAALVIAESWQRRRSARAARSAP
jgi:uncharacterized membrane protein YfhO